LTFPFLQSAPPDKSSGQCKSGSVAKSGSLRRNSESRLCFLFCASKKQWQKIAYYNYNKKALHCQSLFSILHNFLAKNANFQKKCGTFFQIPLYKTEKM